ncbi:MAG TPA: hypothetical protein VK614_10380 [Allosphingosinicella sp.]|nr:hypothetical protein [Allosphingosinicella sp.]
MSRRRIIQLFVLAALVLAPFGRIGIAQAMAGHDAPMASHCAGQPMPDQGKGHRMALDCMIACAAMTAAAAPFVPPPPALRAAPSAMVAPLLAGIRPEADPPPPRHA